MKKRIKVIKVTKLYKGLVELRDYSVNQYIQYGIFVEIEFNKEIMTLSPKQLNDNIQSTSKLFTSKIGGKSYKLYGYNWKPDEIDL